MQSKQNTWENRRNLLTPRTLTITYNIGILKDPNANRCVFDLESYVMRTETNYIMRNKTIEMKAQEDSVRLKGCHGYILVYDANSRESFERVRDYCQRLSVKGMDHIPILVVGWNEGLKNTAVRAEEGEQFAMDIGNLAFYECTGPDANCADKVYEALIENMSMYSVSGFRDKVGCTIL